MLAAEAVLAKRGHGTTVVSGQKAKCKLCGEAVENNWHTKAECSSCADVVECRKHMVAAVHAALDESLPARAVEAKAALKEI